MTESRREGTRPPAQPPRNKEEKSIHYITDSGVITRVYEQVYDKGGTPQHYFITRGIDGTIASVREVEMADKDIVPALTDPLEEGQAVFCPGIPTDYGTFDDLYDDVMEHIQKFVDLSEFYLYMGGIYIMFTYIYDTYSEVPYIKIMGDFETGKSRYLKTIGLPCYRPFIVNSGSTLASLRRIITKTRGTMVIDEMDFGKRDELTNTVIKMINAGNSFLGGSTMLCEEGSGRTKHQEKSMNLFGPKVFAHRHEFNDEASVSRCIEIQSVKTENRKIIMESDFDIMDSAERLRNKLLMWRLDTILGKKRDDYTDNYIDGIGPRLNKTVNPILKMLSGSKGKHIVEILTDHLQQQKKRKTINRSTHVEGAILEAILYSGEADTQYQGHGKRYTKMSVSQLLDVAKRNGLEGVGLYSTRGEMGFSKVITDILHLELFGYRKKKYVVWDEVKLAQVCANYGIPFGIHKVTEYDFTRDHDDYNFSNLI